MDLPSRANNSAPMSLAPHGFGHPKLEFSMISLDASRISGRPHLGHGKSIPPRLAASFGRCPPMPSGCASQPLSGLRVTRVQTGTSYSVGGGSGLVGTCSPPFLGGFPCDLATPFWRESRGSGFTALRSAKPTEGYSGGVLLSLRRVLSGGFSHNAESSFRDIFISS
jgi:hypothetical protein